MNTTKNWIPKVIALLVVCIGMACLQVHSSATTLARLDSMSPTDYLQYQRDHIHPHSFIFHYIVMLITGGVFIGVIEFFTYVIGLCFKKPEHES